MTNSRQKHNWAAIKADWMTGRLSTREVGAKHGLSEAAIRQRARKEGWTRQQPAAEPMTPLDYMLSVMNDPDAGARRRDTMAKNAAPYVHAKADAPGKKARRQDEAEEALNDTEWGEDLAPGGKSVH